MINKGVKTVFTQINMLIDNDISTRYNYDGQ
jgi:hypothetical protein